MVRLYCHGNHRPDDCPCQECAELITYAHARVERCPFIENKPTCARCPVHCYDKDHRELIRVVMRYAGPRMLLRHPIMAVQHMVDGRRSPNRGRKETVH